jgi:hypothetical protein
MSTHKVRKSHSASDLTACLEMTHRVHPGSAVVVRALEEEKEGAC